MTSTGIRGSSRGGTTTSENIGELKAVATKDQRAALDHREDGGGTSLGKSPFGVGILGALIGSVCCALPAISLALGLGGVSGLVGLTSYQPYFLAASLLFVIGSTWYLTQRREVCCAGEARWRVAYLMPLVAGGTYLTVYLLINYVVVPMLYGAAPTVLQIGR